MKVLVILILAILGDNSALSYENQALSSNKVKVSVYYETLCSDSLHFFRTQLEPTFNNMQKILDLTLFAYGKIEEKEVSPLSYTFKCQHGEEECKGNKILECAKLFIPFQYFYSKFAFCMMKSSPPYSDTVGRKCSFAWTLIKKCADSEAGDIMLHNAGVSQNNLDVKLNYVPWILINGSNQYQDDAEANLEKVICDVYDGQTRPALCQKYTTTTAATMTQ